MYLFTELKSHIENNLGIDTSNSKGRFKPIREIFRTGDEVDARVYPGSDCLIYTDDSGRKHKGFLFIEGGYNKQVALQRGWSTIVPKYHITNCSTIEEQKRRENFNGHYVFSQKIEKVRDLDGIEKEIQLCRNCLKLQTIIRSVLPVSEYVENYIKNEELNGNFIDVDLPTTREDFIKDNGYTADWDRESHSYRISVRFICENCGIPLNKNYIDGYYLETHHVDGNKSNNSYSNLKALCTLCHANSNDVHKRNFSRGRNKQKLETFIHIFRDKLRNVNNPYLNNY